MKRHQTTLKTLSKTPKNHLLAMGCGRQGLIYAAQENHRKHYVLFYGLLYIDFWASIIQQANVGLRHRHLDYVTPNRCPRNTQPMSPSTCRGGIRYV